MNQVMHDINQDVVTWMQDIGKTMQHPFHVQNTFVTLSQLTNLKLGQK